jgi:hypothetical protein
MAFLTVEIPESLEQKLETHSHVDWDLYIRFELEAKIAQLESAD